MRGVLAALFGLVWLSVAGIAAAQTDEIQSYTNSGQLLFEGVKLRSLFVVPHAADRTLFYGVNFELSHNTPTWDSRRFSGEIRPIIGTHLGPWDLIVNPVVDTEFNGFRNFTFQPEMRRSSLWRQSTTRTSGGCRSSWHLLSSHRRSCSRGFW